MTLELINFPKYILTTNNELYKIYLENKDKEEAFYVSTSTGEHKEYKELSSSIKLSTNYLEDLPSPYSYHEEI